MRKVMLALGLLAVLTGGVWTSRALFGICCGNPGAPCCPVRSR